MKKINVFLIVSALFFGGKMALAQKSCSRLNDSLYLANFYKTNGGLTTWIKKWDLTKPMTTWEGITLNNNGRVRKINLSNNGLTGNVTVNDYFELCELDSLDLSLNKLTGNVPIPTATALASYFNLSRNQLSGNLNSLTSAFTRRDSAQQAGPLDIDLSYNLIAGAFPLVYPQNIRLKKLNLSYNNLTGGISFTLTQQPLLVFLDLSYNQLSLLPPQIVNNINLQTVNLSYNKFTDNITNFAWDNLGNLIDLNLSYNAFSGSLPINLANIKPIKFLDLSSNKLSGVIPTQYGLFNNLSYLNLSYNPLSGAIPDFTKTLSTLKRLYLTSDNLSGSIPTSLSVNGLEELFLNSNALSGLIPPTLGNITSLISLNLNANKLTGNIPSVFGNFKSLKYLFVNNNTLSGELPKELGTMTSLQGLDLSYNAFTGRMPTFPTVNPKLMIVDVSYNRIDSMPDFSSMFSEVRAIDVFNALYVQGNRLTFDDILPNLTPNSRSLLRVFYIPQDSIICAPKTYNLAAGMDFNLDVKVDGALTTNVYRWFKNQRLIDRTNVNNLAFNPLASCDKGNYSVNFTNPAVPTMTLYCNNQYLNISEAPCGDSKGVVELNARPNPAHETVIFTLKTGGTENFNFKIHNVLGQEIYSQIINGSPGDVGVDVSPFAAGMYFYSLHTEGGELLKTKTFQIWR